MLLGTGAALDARLAITRALFELGVSTLGRRSTPQTRTIEAGCLQPLLSQVRCATDMPSPVVGSFKNQLDWCIEAARKVGVEILVVDLSRPELDLPVARVIAPGMRHWLPRFAPGRLYDIPVKLGWRRVAMFEADANPISMFV